MPEYPKPIRRLIRQYAGRAYEIELSLALGELEQQFVAWRSGRISPGELSDHIYAFTRGPAREIEGRYHPRMRLEATLVARAIVLGWLPRDELPPELVEALQQQITMFEQDLADDEQEQ
jgi:hypothetical protein